MHMHIHIARSYIIIVLKWFRYPIWIKVALKGVQNSVDKVVFMIVYD